MIQSLFDDKRRKALNDAIKDGKPLPILAKKPMEDAIGKDSTLDDESFDDGFGDAGPDVDGGTTDGGTVDGGSDLDWGLEGVDGSHAEDFEGMLASGQGMNVGGYEFTYNGPVAGNNIVMGIRCGDDGLIETKTLPMGKETVIDYPADDRRVRITPGVCNKSQMQASIIVEPWYAKGD